MGCWQRHRLRFWIDPWLDGNSISNLAPALITMAPCWRRRTRTIAQALQDRTWILDIQGALGPTTTIEYVNLWRRLQHVSLTLTA